MEIGRLARVSPNMVDFQDKSGLGKDDMQASLAQLKVLREKESAQNCSDDTLNAVDGSSSSSSSGSGRVRSTVGSDNKQSSCA